MVGQTLGQYRIVAHLGEGAMGAVYHAVDEMLDRDVALKFLRPELVHRQDLVERFRIEAITLAKLDHPNITRLLGLTRHEPHLFMVMEYVGGESLSDVVQRGGRVRWREAVVWVGEILAALEYAHGVGIVHRDIKPANIIVRQDARVKVTDFGIARVLGSARRTREGHVIGTLDYMAPEQIRGEEVTGSADLYSTGVLLYEALTGRTPYGGTTEYELMQQHIHGPIPGIGPLASDVPLWFDGLIERAMAKDPADRFPSAGAFRRELERLAAAEPAAAIKHTILAPRPVDRILAPTRLGPAPAAPKRRMTRRHWLAASSAVIVLIGVAYGISLSLAKPPRASEPSVTAPASAFVTPPLPPVAPAPVLQRVEPPNPPPVEERPAVSGQRAADPLSRDSGGAVPPPPRRPSEKAKAFAPVPPNADRDVPKTPERGPELAAAAPVPSVSPEAPKSRPGPRGGDVPTSNGREFDGISLVLITGSDKREEEDAILVFDESSLIVKDEDEKVLRSIPYASVNNATFSQTTRRRLKFIKSTRRNLTLRLDRGELVLHLSSDNVEAILSRIEESTGLTIARD
jgi:serine/threonine-protein kinase